MKLFPILLTLTLAGGAQAASLGGVKTYLGGKLGVQAAGTAGLVRGADRYYALAKAANFDYKQLAAQPGPVRAALQEARAGWTKASPAYEDIEGIVAGVEALSDFDLILDAGTSAAEGERTWCPSTSSCPTARSSPSPATSSG